MSAKEISLLRKTGKLKEAYEMAISDLRLLPQDPWVQTSLFWVLRDICQQLCDRNEIDEASKFLHEMASLLPKMMMRDEQMNNAYNCLYKRLQPNANIVQTALVLSKSDPVRAYEQVKNYINHSNAIDSSLHEDLGWIIYRYINKVNREESKSSTKIRKMLNDYINLKNKRPSMLHSQILNFALGFSKEHPDFKFYRFFLYFWKPETLRAEDLCRSFYNNSEIPSLVSRVCRQFIDSGEDINVEELCEKINLSRIEVLDLIREPQFWKIINLHKENRKDEMFAAFTIYNEKNASYGASYWNSEVLKIAERYMNENESDSWKFIKFFKDWGCENLRNDDWQEEIDDKGNVYPSLAVKAIKRCYEYIRGLRQKDSGILIWLSSLYDVLMEHVKDDEWILRQRAIIYAWQQQFDSAINIYKRLLLNLSDKYYIWSELADYVQGDEDLKIGLLSKALLLEHNEQYLGPIRLTLADLFLKRNLKSEALYELNAYKKNHNKVSNKYSELILQFGDSTNIVSNNKKIYKKFATIAEEYAFSDIEAKEVTLVEKQTKDWGNDCMFTNGVNLTFQTNVRLFPFIMKEKIGTLFRVKYYEKKVKEQPSQDPFATLLMKPPIIRTKYILLCISKIERPLWNEFPQKYGYVKNLNEDKKILSIVTQDSKQVCQIYEKEWGNITKGDYVTFRECVYKKGKGERIIIGNTEKVDKGTALSNFKLGIAVVDDVNTTKELFHFTFGPGTIDGIVQFSDTDLRPEVGQYLEMRYCITKNVKGEYKALVLHIAETDEVNLKAVKTIQGHLILRYREDSHNTPDFAFIEDCYVPRSILEKYCITEDCDVTAFAVYAGAGKWKVFEICERNGN